MNLIQVSKVLFILSNLLILLAANRNLTFPYYLDYFIKIVLFFILFKKFNKNQFRYILLILILSISEILTSYLFDTHNPNFLISNSVITYLIYNTIFKNINQRQTLLMALTGISLVLCLPLFTPYELLSIKSDYNLILRNVPIYILGIFLNISILNFSKILTNIQNYDRTIITSFYYLSISSLGLFISTKYYFASLGGIVNLFLSTLCILFINIYLFSKYKYFKYIFISILIYLSFVFISNNYLDELVKTIDLLWTINFDIQGSLITESPRADFAGFLTCFLDYPFGTGFYGLEKLCRSNSTLEVGLQPHSALISLFLGYPILIIFALFYISIRKDIQTKLFSKLIFSQPTNTNSKYSILLTLARYTHIFNFIFTLLISEIIYKFPLI